MMKKLYIQKMIKVIIAFSTIVAIFFRFIDLDKYSLWQDELAIYIHSFEPFSFILKYTEEFSYHPPLLYLLLKPIYMTISFGETNVRLIHVIVGLLTALLPLLFYWKKEKKESYFYFSLLLLTNTNLIIWSKEALTYSISFFLATFYLCLGDSFYHNPTKKGVLGLTGLVIFISYFNYILALFVALTLFWMLILSFPRKKIFYSTLIITLGSFITYLPWLFTNHLVRKIFSSEKKIEFWSPPLSNKMDAYNPLIEVFNNSFLFLLLTLIALLYLFIKNKKQTLYNPIFLGTMSFILIMYFSSFSSYSVFISKYLNMMIPFVLYMLSFLWLRKSSKLTLISLICYLGFNLYSYPRMSSSRWMQDIRGSLEFIAQQKNNTETVFLNVYSGIWYEPYVLKLFKGKGIKSFYDMGLCTDMEKKKEVLDKLKEGDYIYLNRNDCLANEVIAYLEDKKVLYRKRDFVGPISVLQIEGEKSEE